MNVPGAFLRRLAEQVCAARTMDRLVDPIIADLRLEVAAVRKAPWPRRYSTIARAYVGLWRGFLAHGRSLVTISLVSQQLVMRNAGLRAVRPALAVAALTTVFIIAIPGWVLGTRLWQPEGQRLLLYLVPQALPIAIPAAVLWSALWGIGRRPATSGDRRAIMLTGLIASMAVALLFAMVIPESNQAFREGFFIQEYGHRPPSRGANELSWSALGHELAANPGSHLLRQSYHLRIALSFTPLLLALASAALQMGTPHRAFWQASTTTSIYVMFFWAPVWIWAPVRVAAPELVGWIPTFAAIFAASLFHRRRETVMAGPRAVSGTRDC
jgi:hypothetical protein